jgi:GTP-binding protein HflX
VVDCSSPRFEEQISQVETILGELELGEKPRLLVFNKADLLAEMKSLDPLAFMKASHLSRRYGAITISARDEKSLEPLLAQMERRFWSSRPL